jgi:DHA2 family lincomycin resistance protein-like MFS transporter
MSTDTTQNRDLAPPRSTSLEAERLPPATVRLLAVLLVGTFVVILNETAMNVALSRIMTDLAVDERTAQWLTTGFMLTMAVVIPTSGWLLQRLSTRQVFGLAMALFSTGTLIAALSFVFPVLLAGRVVQACGTAIMMPLMMTTVMEVVPAHMRGRVMGTISMVIACAPAIGPTLSGLILQFFAWRFVFVMVLPIALTILALGLRLVPNVDTGRDARLDVVSLPLAALGFGGLVYGLSLVGNAEAPAWALPAVFGVGALALLAFGWRQVVLQRTDDALLDLRTFAVGEFSLAVVVMALVMLVLFGSIIATPLVLQQVLHAPPLEVGLLLLPGGLLMGLLGPVVGRLYDRVGPRWLVVPGGLTVAVAFAIFATISPATPWWHLLIANLVMSAGLAFMFTPLFTVALGSLPHHLISYGSAVVGTVQQVAGAAGTALFVTIMSTVAASVGGTAEESLAAGARTAFLTVGTVWLLAIVGAFFLRRPPEDANAPGLAVH